MCAAAHAFSIAPRKWLSFICSHAFFFPQGYFGKECFIKLAPFAVVIGVGLVTGN